MRVLLALGLVWAAGPAAEPPPAKAAPTKAAPAKAAPAPRTTPPVQPTRPPAPGAVRTSTPPPPTGTSAPPGPEDTAPSRTEEVYGPPVDLGDTWGYSRRRAPRPRYVRSRDPIYERSYSNPRGFYSGVSVEGNHVPPFPAQTTGQRPAIMTWVGFERTANGSRVFFQLSASVKHRLTQKGTTLTLTMQNTKVSVRNNMRRLDLKYFRTPVREVTVKRNKKANTTTATIHLKRKADPKLALIKGKAGYNLLVVSFRHAGGTKQNPLNY